MRRSRPCMTASDITRCSIGYFLSQTLRMGRNSELRGGDPHGEEARFAPFPYKYAVARRLEP